MMEPRHFLCLWKSCTVSFEGLEDLVAHLCDVHGDDGSCERKHRFSCEWQECDTLVVCTGSRHATRLLCAAKNHLLEHAGFRPAPYIETSPLSGPETCKPSAPGSTPTPGPPVPRLRPSRPLIDTPAVTASSPSTSRAAANPLPRNADAHGLPSPSPSTSPVALVPPPSSSFSCRWSSCSEAGATFTDGQTLLDHILNAHIRQPAKRELIKSLTKDGIEKIYGRVQCAWTRTNGLPCHTTVAVRGKYATHYKEHIIALAKDVGVECAFQLKTQVTVPPKKRPRGRPPKKRDVADKTKTKTKRARAEDELVPRVVYVSLSPWQPGPIKLEPTPGLTPAPDVEPPPSSQEEDLGVDMDMDMDWSLS